MLSPLTAAVFAIFIFGLSWTTAPVAGAADAHWDYTVQGRDWPGVCKTGKRQSPVHLSLNDAVLDTKLGQLQFNYAHDLTIGSYANNGHSLVFALNQTGASKISGGGLKGEYHLHSLHYHWGQDDCDGSEHVIDYTRSPLEIHLVHFNAKYGSLADAKSKGDGLAVVGILFKPAIDSAHVTSKVGQLLSAEWASLVDTLKPAKSEAKDKEVNVTRYIEDLLTTNTKFYRYLGSLTTPGCDEAVIWTVMTQHADVDPALLKKFRQIQLTNAKNENKPSANYRAIQKLHGRVVYTTDEHAQGGATSMAKLSHPAAIVLPSVLLVLFGKLL